MRWLAILALPFVLADGSASAQTNFNRLPPNPSMNSSPNPGNDEVAARRRLEDAGYTDIQGLTSNGDGTFSGRAIRGGRGRIGGREVRVDIDTRGHIREW